MTIQSTVDDVHTRIKYHRPTQTGIDRIAMHRKAAEHFSVVVLDCAPEGRDKEIALQKIEEALFWANAAIARHPMYQAEED